MTQSPFIAALAKCYRRWIFILTILGLALLIGMAPAKAQNKSRVEIFTNSMEAKRGHVYVLASLKQDEILYVYLKGTSGNLDPIVGVADSSLATETLADSFVADIERAVADGRDPLAAFPEIVNKYFLAWNDDGGEGYDAALTFRIPKDGDYQLVVASTMSKKTRGDYHLLIGLNAPEVLTGVAQPTGDKIAVLDRSASRVGVAVQEISGTLTEDKTNTFYNLLELDPGETLYVFAEATSGDLRPIILLNDFGGKPIRSGNIAGQQTQAELEYTFDDLGRNYTLDISGSGKEGITSGDYRLLVGINAPDVLTGKAEETGTLVIKDPIVVKVGVKMDQITDVDQVSENFSVVASLRMDWTDPAYAFSPDECQCRFKTFTGDDFKLFINENGLIWPDFYFFNQQGNRWTQNRLVVVFPDGRASYFERFTATFQAPDFDFKRYPLDTQEFYIRIDQIFPEEIIVFTNLEEFSGLGEQLGEEQWVLTDHDTIISSQEFGSRYSFWFQAKRTISYYILRIFTPILLILIVSWITFFLRDYGRRIEVTSANLLVFVAFNFTISDDLPRLGYLTLLDTILISTFIISAFVIVFNVILKRLEISGRKDIALRIDKYSVWLYPIAYIAAIWTITLLST